MFCLRVVAFTHLIGVRCTSFVMAVGVDYTTFKYTRHILTTFGVMTDLLKRYKKANSD